MMTFTGKQVNPFDIYPGEVCIKDIAHHLALTLRYGGATKWPFSVARHCVIMAGEEMPGDPLTNLLHDAWEAYGGDPIYGMKDRLLVIPPRGWRGYPNPISEVETVMMGRIYKGLGLPKPTESYKMADMIMVSAESQVLLGRPRVFADLAVMVMQGGKEMGEYTRENFMGWGAPWIKEIPLTYHWEEDEELFLNRYNELRLG